MSPPAAPHCLCLSVSVCVSYSCSSWLSLTGSDKSLLVALVGLKGAVYQYNHTQSAGTLTCELEGNTVQPDMGFRGHCEHVTAARHWLLETAGKE